MALLKLFATAIVACAVCFSAREAPAQAVQVGKQSRPIDNESESPRNQRQVAELIVQLGSPVFTAREDASASLLQIGLRALPQLRNVSSADFELQYRAHQIARRIEDSRFEQLSRSFLLDRDPEKSYGLPAWSPFSDIVGTSRTSKLLFLDMLRRQPEIAALIEELTKGKRGGAVSRPGLARLATVASGEAVRIDRKRQQLQVPEIGDLVAILMATTLMEGQAPVEINELLDSSAHVIPISSYMQRRGYGPAIRRLYAQWIPKTHESMASRALYISLMDDLETGAEVARRHVSPNYDPRTREQAIHCLARFGNKSDIPMLIELLDDESVCGEFLKRDLPFFRPSGIEVSDEPPPGAPRLPPPENGRAEILWMVYRICDLAAAAAIMLDGEDPESLFPDFERNSRFGFDSRTVAVRKTPQTQKLRRTQIDAWRSDYDARIAGRND